MNNRHAMYRIRDPDIIRNSGHSLSAIAINAGCSRSLIGHLCTGERTEVSLRIASGISAAIGVTMDALFEPTGRITWQRP